MLTGGPQYPKKHVSVRLLGSGWAQVSHHFWNLSNIYMILKRSCLSKLVKHGQSYISCTHNVPILLQNRKCSLKLLIISKCLTGASANYYVR